MGPSEGQLGGEEGYGVAPDPINPKRLLAGRRMHPEAGGMLEGLEGQRLWLIWRQPLHAYLHGGAARVGVSAEYWAAMTKDGKIVGTVSLEGGTTRARS